MEVRLHVTEEKLDALTVGQVIVLEDAGGAPLKELRNVIALFMVDEELKPLPQSEAKKILDGLKARSAFVEVAQSLFRKVREMAINPPKAEG